MSFTPASIPSLAVWLDASDASTFSFSTGSNVLEWRDKSGFDNHFSQAVTISQPTYTSTPGGYPGVYFSANIQRLESVSNASLGVSSPRTIFAVFHAPTASSIMRLGTGSNATASPPRAFGFDLNPPVSTIWTPYVYGTADITSPVRVTDLVPLYAYYDPTTSTLGGGYNFANIQTKTTALNTTTSNWHIGNRPGTGLGSSNAYCCEFLHYQNVLTDAQRQQVELYLGLKWGVSNSLLPLFVFMNGTQLTSTTVNLSLFKYEPFSYLFTSTGAQSLVLVSASTNIRAFVNQVGTEVHFEAPSGYNGTPSATESIVFRTSPGNVTYTVNVSIAAGRFTAPVLSSFSLSKNTSIPDTYGSPILFTSPIPISIPRSLTTLPPGIGFVQVDSKNFYLTGTPLTIVPTAAYNILGFGTPDTSKVVSKTITISVSDETMSTSLAGGSNVSNMIVDFPITERTITANYPNRFAGNLVYTWTPALPDGLQFIDLSGNTISNGFAPLDSNSTIRLAGVPTLAAAYGFANAGISNYAVAVRATRQTSPQINSTLSLNFSFNETVLFTPVSNVSVYTNAPISIGSVPFTARTYFAPSPVDMQYIVATGPLPTGTILSHTTGSSNAFLTGTPTTPGITTTTLTAQNSNGVYRDISVNINVSNDIVQFTAGSTPADVCYNFVISRPLNQPLTNYYPSNIQYSASSASGTAITFSTANIPSGVVASVSGSTLTLTGIPDSVQGLQAAVITATSAVTGTDVSRALNYAVLTDDVCLQSPKGTLTFFQNQAITPVRFTGTTLSERPVTRWSSSNLPNGLSLSATGTLLGTPTDASTGTFDVIASTGYVLDTNSIPYTTIADNVLVSLVNDPSVVSEQFSLDLRVLVYSGGAGNIVYTDQVSPRQPTGPTLSASGTTLTGDFSQVTPLLPQYRFKLDASAIGASVTSEAFLVTTGNPGVQRRFVLDVSSTTALVAPPSFAFPKGVSKLFSNEQSLFSFPGPNTATCNSPSNWSSVFTGSNIEYGDIADIAQSSNTCILVNGANMYRSADGGATWAIVTDICTIPGIVGGYQNLPPFGIFTTAGPILTSVATDGNSNWLALGAGFDSNVSGASRTIIRTSSNDGVSWVDASLSPAFVDIMKSARLYYNQGRYFYAHSNGINPTYRADASNLSVWTGAAGGMPAFVAGIGRVFEFSNSTALAGGDGAASLYKSTNNGTNWSPIAIGASTSVVDIRYAGGKWYLVTDDGLYTSTDATTFTQVGPTIGLGIDFDGASFNMLYSGVPPLADMVTVPYDTSLSSAYGGSTNMTTIQTKRMMTRIIDNGPSGLQIASFNTKSSFIEPAQTAYTFLQYAGANVDVRLTPTSNFIYYFALDLPQGLRLIRDTSGILADISGIPTRYSAEYQQSLLIASVPGDQTLTILPISSRVISPFILKKQEGAGSYTAFLRQYVTVNGAQASRDSVALPVETRPIGEFMHPGAPMVSTDSNCPC